MPNNFMLNLRDLKQKGVDLNKLIQTNHIRILVLVIYLIGLWLGTMLFTKNSSVSNIVKNGIDYLINSEYLKTFTILISANIGTIAAIFFSGFSACGLITSVGLPCIYGIICALINCCIYSSYKVNGIFFALIVIIPFAVITSLLITALSDNSINLTKKLVKAVAFGEPSKRGEAKTYIFFGLIIIAIECVFILFQAFLITKTGKMILNL